MKTTSQKRIIAALIAVTSLVMSACDKIDSSSSNNSETLHTNFYTPEWSAEIPCHDLVFDYANIDTYTVTSASTNLIWQLTLPQDSSLLYQTSNIKKYPIYGYGYSLGSPNLPFTYLHKVPFTKGSSIKLIPIANATITDSSYHQISAITYDHSDANGVFFKLKGNYKMMMQKMPVSTGADSVRFVYGDYLIMVKTRKK
jgi:hypothetical protein